jgi:hypothetical protein
MLKKEGASDVVPSLVPHFLSQPATASLSLPTPNFFLHGLSTPLFSSVPYSHSYNVPFFVYFHKLLLLHFLPLEKLLAYGRVQFCHNRMTRIRAGSWSCAFYSKGSSCVFSRLFTVHGGHRLSVVRTPVDVASGHTF